MGEIAAAHGSIPEAWVERLFDRMLHSYGKKFTDQWGGSDPQKLINHWMESLSGFTAEELRRGVAALDGQEWPPSLPAFKRMCRPPIDPLEAYYEALQGIQAREAGNIGEWRHPAIYWAMVRVSAFDMKDKLYSAIKVRWENTLTEELAKNEWPEIPMPMIALPAPTNSKKDRDAATRVLNELNANGIVKKPGDLTNHKRWAAKVLKRQSEGEVMPHIAVKWAQEELSQ